MDKGNIAVRDLLTGERLVFTISRALQVTSVALALALGFVVPVGTISREKAHETCIISSSTSIPSILLLLFHFFSLPGISHTCS